GGSVGHGRSPALRSEDRGPDGRGPLAAVFDFLGVPTPDDAGQFLRVPENLGSARGAGEVVTRNRQKWKQRMAPALRRRIERVTADLLDQLGYEREHPGIATGRVPPPHTPAYPLLAPSP